ncbi:MAG TPA: vanadium-dependent haloperoxidase [Rhodocyclaceae bacterium]|nr:vanadium-dependent haloperoxidase [Rhodocyclaceae bacterium]
MQKQSISFWRRGFLAFLLVPAMLVPAASQADVVTDWNQIAIKTVLENPPGSLFSVRNLAIVHLAVHDAVNAVDRRYQPYLVDTKAATGTSPEVAAVAAAHGVLLALYPSQKSVLDAALSSSLAKIPDGEGKTLGLALGQQVAARHIEARKDDGSDRKVEYVANNDPATWKPTAPAFLPAANPQFAQVRPFFLRSPLQFDPGAPLAITSKQFADEFEEVKRLGAANSKERTPDQTAVAVFWTAPSYVIFSGVARQVSDAKKFSLHDNARLFALLNGATADAYIAGWAAKFKYPRARPITLIREAGKLGVPALKADPDWEPLLTTPNHPNYISGHSVFAGAAERVLQAVFATDVIPPASATYPAGAITRRYRKISDITLENDNGRVWGGIHTRETVGQGGADLGRKVGEFAAANHLVSAKPGSLASAN